MRDDDAACPGRSIPAVAASEGNHATADAMRFSDCPSEPRPPPCIPKPARRLGFELTVQAAARLCVAECLLQLVYKNTRVRV